MAGADHPPLVAPATLHKGVGYFDLNYARGPQWYRGHFPLRVVAHQRARRYGRPPLAMEASGYYLDHPAAVNRIAEDLPGVKAIVMLRDPVERAHSAHRNATHRGLEALGFDEAIAAEQERNAGERERMAADPAYRSVADRHHSYLRRGQYVERLEVFFDLLGRDHVCVLFSEHFAEHPETEYARVLDFLDLPDHRPEQVRALERRAACRDERARTADPGAALRAVRERLETLLGEPLAWRQPYRGVRRPA